MTSESTIVVRYAETDQMGIAHHANYPVWFEVARTDFIKKLGLTYSEMEKMGVMTPLAELGCRYLRPTHYEDALRVIVRVRRLTPSRIEFGYEVFREGEDSPCCTGFTLHAWVDSSTFRPLNMKRAYPQIYSAIGEMMEPEA